MDHATADAHDPPHLSGRSDTTMVPLAEPGPSAADARLSGLNLRF
ncbi:MAG: hypothetical protein WA446_03790 [Steroidobacteraceae bacterium]